MSLPVDSWTILGSDAVMIARALVLALILASSLPCVARAQDDDPARAAAARALFQEGVELARREAYGDAADRFRRAYALRPAPSIAFNLASALTHEGRLVEASEVLARALRDPALDADMRTALQTQHAALAPRLGRVVVRVEGDPSGAAVQLDGRELPAEALGIALPVDPGAHEATATRDGAEVVRGGVEVAEGASGEIVLDVPAPVRPEAIDARIGGEPVDTTPPPAGGGDDAVWIGLGIGIGAVVVGAVVTTAVLLTQDSGTMTPVTGNAMPGVITW